MIWCISDKTTYLYIYLTFYTLSSTYKNVAARKNTFDCIFSKVYANFTTCKTLCSFQDLCLANFWSQTRFSLMKNLKVFFHQIHFHLFFSFSHLSQKFLSLIFQNVPRKNLNACHWLYTRDLGKCLCSSHHICSNLFPLIEELKSVLS